ncbi:YndJ family transporter [Rubrivirga sp. IMCC43871]|uniref:YndJ family transporter n=1 Tax=Rubrivirga sp. IMCC43871 TaxID=3391575 RepID=UPI00398FD7F5
MPLFDRRLARVALAGMVAWLALLFVPLATGSGAEEEVGHLVLLAPLVLVPLFLVASVPAGFGAAPRALSAASWLMLPGALGAAGSLLVAPGPLAGALAALWLIPTTVVAAQMVAAVARQRGLADAAEIALAFGWATLPGGAVWLVLARSGVDTGYSSLVSLLTAAHFHYAGAFVLIWAGLLGRALAPRWRTIHAVLVVGLVVGFWGVAAGIALGRGPASGSVVEAVGVALLTLAAVGVGGLGVVRAGDVEDRKTSVMLAVSGGALVLAMALAAWFQFGARLGLGQPDVSWMAARHGALNAYGFALWGALGWRRIRPQPAALSG